MGAALSCLAQQAAFCCTSLACNACCKSCGCKSSTATRIAYGVLFVLFVILAWSMLSDWVESELEKVNRLALGIKSINVKEVVGALGVFRVCFSMTCFYLFMALLMIGVQSGRDVRRSIQNGWWALKIILVIGILVGSFYIPNDFFYGWSIVGIVGSAIFILIQLVLLIEFACNWQETWFEKWEDSDNNGWFVLMLVCTFLIYGFSIALTVIMYIYFAGPAECALQKFIISFNLIISSLISALSVTPFVQEHNPHTGLLPSAVISCYCTYLVFSALSNLPYDANNQCAEPTSSATFQTLTTVIGSLLTLVSIAYATVRTAEHSSMSALGFDNDEYEPLLELGSDEDGDDENGHVHYNWSFFHFTFALASLYMMEVLTNWGTITINSDKGNVHVLSGWSSAWVKVGTSWVALLLYCWTVVAPAICRDRDFGY